MIFFNLSPPKKPWFFDIQKAKKEEQVLNYEQTLLKASNEIRNSVVSLFQEHIRYQNLKETYIHADKVSSLMKDKYRNGLIDYTDVLQSQQNRLQAQIEKIKSKGNLYLNLINFYKAIGGGNSFE